MDEWIDVVKKSGKTINLSEIEIDEDLLNAIKTHELEHSSVRDSIMSNMVEKFWEWMPVHDHFPDEEEDEDENEKKEEENEDENEKKEKNQFIIYYVNVWKLSPKFETFICVREVNVEDVFEVEERPDIDQAWIINQLNGELKDDSSWRIKVLNDYGIKKKYGDTWKQTAIVMGKFNRINLGRKWIYGRIYREILDDALQNGADVLEGLPLEYLLLYADNEKHAENMRYNLHDEKQIQDYANTHLDKPYTDNKIDDILLTYSREISVIYSAVLSYKGQDGYLPGDTNEMLQPAFKSYEVLREMIDPMLYVMQFSSFPHNQLILA